MQQTALIRELQTYHNPGECIPPLWQRQCYPVLTIFLTPGIIYGTESHVIHIMNKGYRFFVDWFNVLSNDGQPFHLTNSLERRFLAWETWDLLRICIYWFRVFCIAIDSHITSLQWSGMAVQWKPFFFSLKWQQKGTPDSTNYATTHQMFLAHRDALGRRPSAAAAGYRSVPLYVSQTPLARR